MKRHTLLYVAALLCLLCFTTKTETFAQRDTTGCTPYPCFAPSHNRMDNTIYPISWERTTDEFRTGWLYKFHVEAGNVYMWNSGSNNSIYINGVRIKTHITLYYDDNGTFQTPITSSNQVIGNAGFAQAMPWRANYTGTVGLMITCGTTDESICDTMVDSLRIVYYMVDEANSADILMMGRGHDFVNISCDNLEHPIYDSGSGYIVSNSSFASSFHPACCREFKFTSFVNVS